MGPYPNKPPNVELVDEKQRFAALEGEWEDLHRNSPRATPFQSWAWLYSWWEHYGEGYGLRLITIRDEGLLVGIIPLMLERRRGFGRLLFVGTGITDNLDLLARGGWEDNVCETGVQVLRRMEAWQLADLHQLRPEAAAWGIFRRWRGPRIHIRQDGCPLVDVRPWDELLMSVSTRLRKNARRALRRAEEDGVRSVLAGPEEAEQAARRLVALHREMLGGRGINPEHLTERFESHVVAAAKRLTACRAGGINESWRDGEVLASHFLLFGHDLVGDYMVGAKQETFQRYQWSSLQVRDALNIARSKNAAHLDLLRGEEPYKLRWSSRVVPTHRVILGRRWISWLPYVGYHTLYTRARRYASSGDAPHWIKSAADRYRALRRYGTNQYHAKDERS